MSVNDQKHLQNLQLTLNLFDKEERKPIVECFSFSWILHFFFFCAVYFLKIITWQEMSCSRSETLAIPIAFICHGVCIELKSLMYRQNCWKLSETPRNIEIPDWLSEVGPNSPQSQFEFGNWTSELVSSNNDLNCTLNKCVILNNCNKGKDKELNS